MTVFRRLIKCGFLVVVLMFASTVMRADSINYTFAGTGSGTLNGSSFSNDAFTVSINGDTANVAFQNDLGAFAIENLAGTIALSGIGTASFTAPLFVFGGNGADEIGFGNLSQGNLIAAFSTGQGLASYELASNFGPVPIINNNLIQFSGVATSLGLLGYATMSNVTFQSTVSPVPEPSSMLLLVTGLLGVTLMFRRKVVG